MKTLEKNKNQINLIDEKQKTKPKDFQKVGAHKKSWEQFNPQNTKLKSLDEKIFKIQTDFDFHKNLVHNKSMSFGAKGHGYSDKANIWKILMPKLKEKRLMAKSKPDDIFTFESTAGGWAYHSTLYVTIVDLDTGEKEVYPFHMADENRNKLFISASALSYWEARALIHIFKLPFEDDMTPEERAVGKSPAKPIQRIKLTGKDLAEKLNENNPKHQNVFKGWLEKTKSKNKTFADFKEAIKNTTKQGKLETLNTHIN